MSESLIHVNSDGSTNLLIAKINQTLIATNGSVTIDTVGINGVQHFRPLGEHYKVSTYSYPVVLDISNQVNPMLLAGWHVGRQSKKAIWMTWDYTHEVANRYELVTLQLLFVFVGFVFVSGDFYLTIQGLRGFLAHKLIMTYDLAAGYERRKLVLFTWSCSNILSLLYADAVCLSSSSTSLLWFFAIILVGTCYNCCFFVLLGLVSRIPSPFLHVVIFSPSVMNHVVYLIFEIVHMACYQPC
ncbi:unnamed protein product [Aphanomyces euteiches]|nr:hypothetical protein AeRB84_004175 [Aphanomyces euteiches]